MATFNKKRGLFLGVCASFIIFAAGCGNNEETTESESSAAEESTEVVTTASISNNPADVVAGLSQMVLGFMQSLMMLQLKKKSL